MRSIKLDAFQGTARVLGRECSVVLSAGVLGIHARQETQEEEITPQPDPEFAMRILEALHVQDVLCGGESAQRFGLKPGTAAIYRVDGGDYVFEATDFEVPGGTLIRATNFAALLAALLAKYSDPSSSLVAFEVEVDHPKADVTQAQELPGKVMSAPGATPSPAHAQATNPARRPRKPPITLAQPAPTTPVAEHVPEVVKLPEAQPQPAPSPKPALHLVGGLEEEDGCPNDPDPEPKQLAGNVVADLIPVPESLARATKLREVVSALMSRGRSTAEQIEAACAAFKALVPCPVPVLDRIPAENLHDRLGMVFTVLNIGQAS